MRILTTTIATGLVLAMIYAILAVGLALTHRVDKTFNLSLGACVVLTPMVHAACAAAGWPFLLAALAGVGSSAALGWIVYATLVERLKDRSPLTSIIATFAVLLIVEQTMLVVWGSEYVRIDQLLWGRSGINLGALRITGQHVWLLFLGALMLSALHYALQRTRAGIQLRAVGSDAPVAESLGVDTRRAVRASVVVASAASGAVGLAIAPILFLDYHSGTGLILKALVALIVGGVHSTWGGVIGAMIIGLGEAFSGYVSADWTDTLVYGALIVLLALRHGERTILDAR